jgi:hypothetical protein
MERAQEQDFSNLPNLSWFFVPTASSTDLGTFVGNALTIVYGKERQAFVVPTVVLRGLNEKRGDGGTS